MQKRNDLKTFSWLIKANIIYNNHMLSLALSEIQSVFISKCGYMSSWSPLEALAMTDIAPVIQRPQYEMDRQL